MLSGRPRAHNESKNNKLLDIYSQHLPYISSKLWSLLETSRMNEMELKL